MAIYGDNEIWHEADGTWTIDLAPWAGRIKKIPSREMAVEFLDVAYQAMQTYAQNAAVED